MTIRDLGFMVNEEINILVLNTEGRLLDFYDGKNSIMEQLLDREIIQIIKVTFNAIWLQVK